MMFDSRCISCSIARAIIECTITYARPTTRYVHMSIGIRLDSTSSENQGELSSKHEQYTIDNDPSTSITYPHDDQHCRNTQWRFLVSDPQNIMLA